MIVAFTTTTTYLYNSTAAMISTNYFHFSANYFGMCSLLNFVGLILGGYLSSILIKKYCPINVICFGMSIVGIPLILFVFFTDSIIKNENYMLLFFVLTALLNVGLGIIYPSGSYLALNSLECSTTASSIMNFIKIGCPAVVIAITSFTKLSIINSFEIPLYISFIVTMVFLMALFITEFRANKSRPQFLTPLENDFINEL